jgi:hypothetical protein
MNIPYFEELVAIRKMLEENLPRFPHRRCSHASRLVWWIVGIEEAGGYYAPRNCLHAWNYDKSRELYVDLSLDQFEEGASAISLLPHTTEKLLIHPTHTANQRATEISALCGNFLKVVNNLYELYFTNYCPSRVSGPTK